MRSATAARAWGAQEGPQAVRRRRHLGEPHSRAARRTQESGLGHDETKTESASTGDLASPVGRAGQLGPDGLAGMRLPRDVCGIPAWSEPLSRTRRPWYWVHVHDGFSLAQGAGRRRGRARGRRACCATPCGNGPTLKAPKRSTCAPHDPGPRGISHAPLGERTDIEDHGDAKPCAGVLAGHAPQQRQRGRKNCRASRRHDPPATRGAEPALAEDVDTSTTTPCCDVDSLRPCQQKAATPRGGSNIGPGPVLPGGPSRHPRARLVRDARDCHLVPQPDCRGRIVCALRWWLRCERVAFGSSSMRLLRLENQSCHRRGHRPCPVAHAPRNKSGLSSDDFDVSRGARIRREPVLAPCGHSAAVTDFPVTHSARCAPNKVVTHRPAGLARTRAWCWAGRQNPTWAPCLLAATEMTCIAPRLVW